MSPPIPHNVASLRGAVRWMIVLLPWMCLGSGHLRGGVDPSPASVTEEDFAALREKSPFLRSLDLSQSLILIGVATIGEELFVTVYDRESRQTHVVTGAVNPQGWRLEGIEGDQSDWKTVTAQVAVGGGEIVTVRFDEQQIKSGAARPGARRGPGNESPTLVRIRREGVSGDGFRGPPPPEVVKKLEQLSEEQRERLVREMGEIRDRNRDMSSEDRQRIFIRMVDRAAEGRR